MTADDPVKAILDRYTTPRGVKADAYDAFHASETTADLQPLLDRLPLARTVKAALWDLKAKEGSMLPRETKFGRDGKELPPKAAESQGASQPSRVKDFIGEHYRHFNSSTLKDAADAYVKLLAGGGEMFVAMAGAMSTAELGRSLAPMIRSKKIHAICCTGANLEEDLFNLVAHDEYEKIPQYDELTPAQETQLFRRHINRVTDTGIPEKAAMTPIEEAVMRRWEDATRTKTRLFPHELVLNIIRSEELKSQYQGNVANSWLAAAADMDLPIFVPGWEDSTLGQVFAGLCHSGTFEPSLMKTGIEYMLDLVKWYQEHSKAHDMGFFQIGGGIAGDFSICVVPLIEQDIKEPVNKWKYFAQVSDAVTSYGGYSGAAPNEKITWGKLEADTPSFAIESDASIVVPLIFAHVLGW